MPDRQERNCAVSCHHREGDPACSSYPGHAKYAEQLAIEAGTSPDSENYEILRVEQVYSHLVLEVQYPNCVKCAYEGKKILVYLSTSPVDAMRWRKIDPHFRGSKPGKKEAPSPSARFPATSEGWVDALTYAGMKANKV